MYLIDFNIYYFYYQKFQEKCHQYWPIGRINGGEDSLILTDVGLQIDYISEVEASYYTTRTLEYVQ